MKFYKLLTLSFLSLILVSCSNNKENVEQNIDESIIESNDEKDKTINETKNEKDRSIEESENEESKEETKTNKLTNVDDLKEGQKLTIDNDFDVYKNSSDAYNRTNSKIKYNSGIYYVYKLDKNGINLSTNQYEAGGWANYDTISVSKIENVKKVEANENNNKVKSPKTNTSNNTTSKKSKSWSWSYPDSINLLNKYNAYYNIGSNSIYLTFDNGYEYKNNTNEILDILRRNNVKATFFTTGSFMRENPDVTRRIFNEGHNLSNHTERHLAQGKVSSDEIKKDIKDWEITASNIVGSNPDTHLMRPPEGSYSEESLKVANDLGYKTIFWAYAYNDWDTSNQPDPSSSLDKLVKNTKPGDIILLHTVSDTNIKILEEYISICKSLGYNFDLIK